MPSEGDVVQGLHILLAEDDDNDVRITRRAISKAGLAAELSVVLRVIKAIQELYRDYIQSKS